ncbi:DUF917 family protein [Salinicola sp. RZ23]|uniref:S-methyl thiohydantoin desulfurase domain-containing protein n=1 Tax=Salinicola sp. RZ23 TaxID=1949087 RepID=UPI0018E523E5|nr:DUF917 family protein [Salinicola sp. RZ23]
MWPLSRPVLVLLSLIALDHPEMAVVCVDQSTGLSVGTGRDPDTHTNNNTQRGKRHGPARRHPSESNCMTFQYGLDDFRHVVTGAALMASGGGGSYHDAMRVLEQLEASGWSGSVEIKDYDGATDACVLAMMGSPDAAEDLSLAAIQRAMNNTVDAFRTLCGTTPTCVIPVEIGPINSLVPLIAALGDTPVKWVVNGDGSGRAVPELPQTLYSGAATLTASPCVLADNAQRGEDARSVRLQAATAADVESLAGSVVAAFGSYAGIMLWPSTAANGFALTDHYLSGTLEQVRALGAYMEDADSPHTTEHIVAKLESLTGRIATSALTNGYITEVTQSTNGASLDVGIIRLDDTPDPRDSTSTHYLYNMNENLILYAAQDGAPVIIAPDSICYYSEATGRGFSNAFDDLAPYHDRQTGKSTGVPVSVISIRAASAFRDATGVCDSFAGLLRRIGYAGGPLKGPA